MSKPTITTGFARELIDFAPDEQVKQLGFEESQLQGTVALYNMLERNRCAYLADEVGMGKTYVALGVMALVRYFDPHARIVVIAPRENIQRKWIKELKNFVRSNWKVTGNRVKSLQGGPVWAPVYCDSLRSFIHEATLQPDRDFFLRMTSFSVALRQLEQRKRLRHQLRGELPWIETGLLSGRTPEEFREGFGVALNAGFPSVDLLVVDEAHNLKHGFSEHGSTRNRLLGLALGHEKGQAAAPAWYGVKPKKVLLLSATPFEDDYGAIHRQLDVLGFGKARLYDGDRSTALPVSRLSSRDAPEQERREIVGRLLVRRVSGLRIAGEVHTKNMYRREWRKGGYAEHDAPMRIEDPKQRLVVGLMQKKVAEILQHERFNNHFQIGMLSSFESFLESLDTARRHGRGAGQEDEEMEGPSAFDGDQGETSTERRGVDSDAVAEVVSSYRTRFGTSLPHPKLDTTADAFASAFDDGDKTLIFVRRVRTVDELAAKLDGRFDAWIRRRMEVALPGLADEIAGLFRRYARERARRPEEAHESFDLDEQEPDPEELPIDRASSSVDDAGSSESFFAWFFRGQGPSRVLSGAAFQKNRLSSQSSVYATFFEDDMVAWLLDRPANTLAAFADQLGRDATEVREELQQRAYRHFNRWAHERGFPRQQVFLSYQQAALDMLETSDGQFASQARIILEERFPHTATGVMKPPAGFPPPEEALGITTFITELVKRPRLREQIWPEDAGEDFRGPFRRREQRRELLSAMCRLGASYVDLYLLAIQPIGSLELKAESASQAPVDELANAFLDVLEQQMEHREFGAFYELSHAASAFDLILAVNFPDVPNGELDELAQRYGAVLQRQVPVGRMAGGVNKRLVSQFRMPGFPLVLVTTDVLQEGEDLHTFCRRIVHYGITWTPSAMEQRTGRIDRIGSLVQRQLDGRDGPAEPEELLQVHYPHLQDTVEVLQVRCVLRRLNKFFRLIHTPKGDADQLTSRLDAAKEILEELDELPVFEGLLESAFPVRDQWLQGRLTADAFTRPDIAEHHGHLERLWEQLCERYAVRTLRSARALMHRAFVLVTGGRLLPRDAEERGAEQEIRLELRSRVAGDGVILRCVTEIGDVDIRENDEVLDELYALQRDLGRAKVCVRPDESSGTDRLFVEADLIFHPRTTQLEELELLVRRTALAAAKLESALMGVHA